MSHSYCTLWDVLFLQTPVASPLRFFQASAQMAAPKRPSRTFYMSPMVTHGPFYLFTAFILHGTYHPIYWVFICGSSPLPHTQHTVYLFVDYLPLPAPLHCPLHEGRKLAYFIPCCTPTTWWVPGTEWTYSRFVKWRNGSSVLCVATWHKMNICWIKQYFNEWVRGRPVIHSRSCR